METEKKFVIYRRPSFRWRGIEEAAKGLNVSRTAIALYLAGRTNTLSKAKRDRIKIVTCGKRKAV